VCSGAKRTRNTLEQITSGFEGDPFETQYSDAIYDATKAGLFKMLQELGAQHESVMIIGHNPTIYELCALMAAQGADNFMNRLSEGYTPATLSIFEFPIENWADLNPNDGKLVEYAAPLDYNTPMRPTRWM
jgi:phosphohistidine phosphatase